MDRIKVSIQRGNEKGVKQVGFFYTRWVDTRLLLVADKTIQIWDETGKVLYEFKPSREK